MQSMILLLLWHSKVIINCQRRLIVSFCIYVESPVVGRWSFLMTQPSPFHLYLVLIPGSVWGLDLSLTCCKKAVSRMGSVNQRTDWKRKRLQGACARMCASFQSSVSYSCVCLLAWVYMMGMEINEHGHIPIEILLWRSVGPERPLPDVTKVLISVQAVVEGTYRTWWCLFLPQDDGQLGLVTLEDHPLYPMLQTIT